ncbi:MAG: DUF4350 domain-containing protein [Cyanobacteria bacterium]|nr:DUF4350 domain-containing protein [Cyanobacteriota bacterium]
MSTRQFWILFFACLLCIVLAVLGLLLLKRGETVQEQLANPTVFNVKPSGYKAWHDTLTQIGLPVTIWRHPLILLPPEKTGEKSQMLMVSPLDVVRIGPSFVSPLGDQQLAAMTEWMEAGNTVIWLDLFYEKQKADYLARFDISATGDSQPPAQNKALEIRNTSSTPSTTKILTSVDPKLNAYVKKPLLTKQWWRFLKATTKSKVLLQDSEGHALLLRHPVGEGHLIVGTVDDLGSNKHLFDGSDNLQWLSNLMIQEKKSVLVNEYVHGFSALPDLMDYYFKTPLGQIFLQLGILFSLIVWLSFKPWRPIERGVTSKRNLVLAASATTTEANNLSIFVNAMATLYYKAHATQVPLQIMTQRLEMVLRKRFQINPSDSDGIRRLESVIDSLLFSTEDPKQVEKSKQTQRWITAYQTAKRCLSQEKNINGRELMQCYTQLRELLELLDHGRHTLLIR